MTNLLGRLLRIASETLDTWSRRIDFRLLNRRLQEAGVERARRIPTWTSPDELLTLFLLAAECPKGANVVEIGSYTGGSSCYLGAGVKRVSGKLFCVDTWNNETMPEGERDTLTEFLHNTSPIRDSIILRRKRSEELRIEDFDTPLHLVFIDGDHDFEAVKTDFEIVQQWLADDGVIAFHDFGNRNYEGVSRVVGDALASGKWVIDGLVESLVWIKRAKWIPLDAKLTGCPPDSQARFKRRSMRRRLE